MVIRIMRRRREYIVYFDREVCGYFMVLGDSIF